MEGHLDDRDQWGGAAWSGQGALHQRRAGRRRRQDFRAGVGHHQFDCEAPEIKTTERTLTWRLTCRGQLDADVAGEFNFDTPQHYTAMVTSQGRMAGALISDVKTGIEGERVGDCQ
jgi:hypothetical protein